MILEVETCEDAIDVGAETIADTAIVVGGSITPTAPGFACDDHRIACRDRDVALRVLDDDGTADLGECLRAIGDRQEEDVMFVLVQYLGVGRIRMKTRVGRIIHPRCGMGDVDGERFTHLEMPGRDAVDEQALDIYIQRVTASILQEIHPEGTIGIALHLTCHDAVVIALQPCSAGVDAVGAPDGDGAGRRGEVTAEDTQRTLVARRPVEVETDRIDLDDAIAGDNQGLVVAAEIADVGADEGAGCEGVAPVGIQALVGVAVGRAGIELEDAGARSVSFLGYIVVVAIILDDADFLDAEARSVFDNHLIVRIVIDERHLQADMYLRETGQFGVGTSRQECR